MRDGLSLAGSGVAVAVSLITLYLTYFDNRYTLRAAMVETGLQTQRGGSSSPGEPSTVSFRMFATPAFVLSNEGAQTLVISAADLVRADSADGCSADGETRTAFGEGIGTIVIPPGSVQALRAEYPLATIDADDAGGWGLEPIDALWCLRITMFDPKGRRQDPLFPAFRVQVGFNPPTDEDRYPSAAVSHDTVRGANTLASRGVF